MRNAIFYLTYNGLYNFTNGIGTQTQLLITGLESLREPLRRRYGPIDVHVVCPSPDAHTWGYNHAFFRQQQERLASSGHVHLIPYKREPNQDLWEISSWRTLCQNVAPLLRSQTAAYERSLIICVDQPWLHTPYALGIGQTLQHQVNMLLVFYSTAFIRGGETLNPAELIWEQEAIEASKPGSRVTLADICPSSTMHLRTHFRLSTAQFAPYTPSILLDDPIFALRDEAVVRRVLQAYSIPLEADLVLAFGRAAPIKGFEKLIPALAPLRDRIHFVLISVPYINDTSQQRVYDELLQQHAIRATHIKEFTRDLARALCQWARTKIVAIPSRHETFSNIPLEVAMWAREKGPVIVASSAGGFVDQIEPAVTGFLVDVSSLEQVTETLRTVLDLSTEAQAAIRHLAYQRVLQRYDFKNNLPATLDWFWSKDPKKPDQNAR
jgi:glycosyltransferase involved in cell wall biosynthesis